MMENVGALGIITGFASSFWPVWLCLAAVFVVIYFFKKQLGIFGRLFNSNVGILGVILCLFWVFTAIFADVIAPLDPRVQVSIMQNAVPGSINPDTGMVFLFGGDLLARDVFSRVVYGARIVLTIAPAATMIAFLVGITLGLPAGYFGGRIDSILSFFANLVLAFPVILLFYLLVTPGIMETWLPYALGGGLFVFPTLFFFVLFYTRFYGRNDKLVPYLAATVIAGGWIWMNLMSTSTFIAKLNEAGLTWIGSLLNWRIFNIFGVDPNELNIFIAVVFASAPGVFRIVRGLTLDIQTQGLCGGCPDTR